MKRLMVAGCLGIALWVTGCGGGSDGGEGNPTPPVEQNAPPVARAGEGQNVIRGVTVTLDGSGSTDANGDTITYQWTLVSRPDGSTAQLSSATDVRPTFTADLTGSYVFSLVVRDGQASSEAAIVTITASVANAAPVAHAGKDQSVTVGSNVTLDASGSTDANGDALTYQWTLVSRPEGSAAQLSSTTDARPTFTTDAAGSYVFSLVAHDGQVSSEATTVTITASVANAAPVARAGKDQSVTAGSNVTLDASGSTDANGDALTYLWTLVSRPEGSAAQLSAATDVRPTFTADAPGSYVFSLQVHDGQLSSDPATVTITASEVNAAPVAHAGENQSVTNGSNVTLDASGSTDANGDALTYQWTLVSRPEGSVAQLSSATDARPTFTADMAGSYVISLIVNDGEADSTPSTVSVTASVANAAPVAHAGENQSVTNGSNVTLDASGSTDANGDALTYQWTLVSRPEGSVAQLSSATDARPTFTADVAGSYVISLIVNDGEADSSSSTVTITASVANAAPVARAGQDQNVTAGSNVTLDANGSTDADGDALTYQWTLVSRPEGSAAQLSSATDARPTFTADVAGSYVFSLVVNDGQADSEASTVTIEAIAPSLAFYRVSSGISGGGDTLLKLPYSSSASSSSSSTCIGSGCPTNVTVETYKLVATGASYTIINLEAVNLTNGSGIEPSFNGLRNGQTINSGETLEFNLQSPFTRNRTVNLRYSFTIKETGDRFTYNVQLTTN